MKRFVLMLLALGLFCRPGTAQQAKPATGPHHAAFLMAHYMPWFQAPPVGAKWGYHWTMNHFHPERVTAGRREAASRFYPLMGLYDSGDPDALDCHVLLMKLAGIDGVVIDWYGNDDYWDYGDNNRNTLRLIEAVKRAGLRYTVMYEDQTVPHLIAGHQFAAGDAVAHGRRLMGWVQQHWFSDPAYLALGGRPVFLVFGAGFYEGAEWTQMFAGLPRPPLLFTESDRRPPAAGAFAWPQPQGGTAGSSRDLDGFYVRAKAWPQAIPGAWPRFQDVYGEAGAQKSFPVIEDRGGKTYAETLTRALGSGQPVIQIATWNDWGEGTQIEPSVEFGYRDLETTQRLRCALNPAFRYVPQDLRLPVALYALQKQFPAKRPQLQAISRLLFAGDLPQARAALARLW